MDKNVIHWIIGIILIISSLGMITAKKPVYSSLWFLLTLMMLAGLYLELSAEFIAVMQILIYAGAILVMFMFVIVLFQDAYQQIAKIEAGSSRWLITVAAAAFFISMIFLGVKLVKLPVSKETLPEGYGTVQTLGRSLYFDFFFPFEAVILLFLIALVGALYTGRKDTIGD